MDIIELERWKPSEANPHKLEYAGQPVAQEVFEELKHRLEGMGYLPDEYFLLDGHWKDGREIPKDADIFCTTDYGASEGVYLDVYLKWYEDGKPITRSFITGKTLGENGNDLDRMFLTASAITKAVHGDHATHARYMKIGGVEEDVGGRVVHLSQQEEKVIIAALVEQRERQEEAMSQTEQLLRRMTGSITAYINETGMRPLRMSDYDKAVLAVRDGELAALSEYSAKVPEQTEALLVEAAGRPGLVGRNMTAMLLNGRTDVDYASYCAACKKAIDINDPEKTLFLLHWAEHAVSKVEPSFYGEMASYAHLDHRFIAKQIIRQCSGEQIRCENTFGSAIRYIHSDNFCKARLENNFGSMTIYFDNAVIQGGTATVKVDNNFGETVLYIPKEWKVHNELEHVFGSVNEHGKCVGTSSAELCLKGETNFGNIEIYYV